MGKDELREVLLGGQSFSWTETDDCFEAVLNERVYRVKSLDDCKADPFLREYFDIDFDYDKARAEIARKDGHLALAVERYPSLRILRQDPWVTTISFILSQNNNIKRIKGLYDKLSMKYGHEVEEGHYSFPTPEELSKATIEELRGLKVGFRDRFIIDAVKKHEILTAIPSMPFDDAQKALEGIDGIGKKVSSCILLFGFHRMEAFPIDVWIRRVLDAWYPNADMAYFEPYPALCQQYLFSMARYVREF